MLKEEGEDKNKSLHFQSSSSSDERNGSKDYHHLSLCPPTTSSLALKTITVCNRFPDCGIYLLVKPYRKS